MDIANERVAAVRQLNKASIEEFSESTGIKVQRIKNIEANRAKVKIDEIIRIADAYNVTTDFLCGMSKFPLPRDASPELVQIFMALDQMSHDELEHIYTLMKQESDETGE